VEIVSERMVLEQFSCKLNVSLLYIHLNYRCLSVVFSNRVLTVTLFIFPSNFYHNILVRAGRVSAPIGPSSVVTQLLTAMKHHTNYITI
jgi:hypothetical protein